LNRVNREGIHKTGKNVEKVMTPLNEGMGRREGVRKKVRRILLESR